jgi:hypothetical protein
MGTSVSPWSRGVPAVGVSPFSGWVTAGGAAGPGDFRNGLMVVRDAVAMGLGLKLAHFSAQLERFVWDRGCA